LLKYFVNSKICYTFAVQLKTIDNMENGIISIKEIRASFDEFTNLENKYIDTMLKMYNLVARAYIQYNNNQGKVTFDIDNNSSQVINATIVRTLRDKNGNDVKGYVKITGFEIDMINQSIKNISILTDDFVSVENVNWLDLDFSYTDVICALKSKIELLNKKALEDLVNS